MVGNLPGPSGVTQSNRVRCMNTNPDHPNRIEPGKRPRITLTPTLVTNEDGKPVIAISVAGGDLQEQTTLNLLMNYIHYGMSAAEAVVAPRFSTKHHEDTFDPNPDRTLAFLEAASLELDNREDIATRAEALSALGHKVTVTPKPKNIANPVMITIDPKTGRLQAAGDPLAQRHAAALP